MVSFFVEDSRRAVAEAELRSLGFFLNDQKTRLRSAGQRQTVTGLVVNERVSVPREERRALRQAVYCCRRFGVEDHLERTGGGLSPEACLKSLLGRVGYVLQADPGCAWAQEARRWLLEEHRRRR